MKISVTLTPEDYIRARRLAMRPRRWLRVIGYMVVVLFAAFFVWHAYDAFVVGGPQKSFWMLAGLTAYFLTIYFVFSPWRTRRIYRQQKTLQRPVELELTGSHFSGSSPHGTFHMAWADFHKWKKNEHLILVYESSALMRMIPLRAIPSPADIELLVSTLKKHLGAEKA
jgi:hypothetical protein